MQRSSTVLVAVSIHFLLLATAVSAATWHVAPDGTGDVATIQDAIDAAAPGDLIELADGIFTGDGNRDLDYLGKALIIASQSGDAAACIIDCGGSAESNHRGVTFHGGETADARLENLTITGGYFHEGNPPYSGCGGAILVTDDAAPTLRGLVLRQNEAMSGGAVYVFTGAPSIADCQFLENDAWWGGGGGLGAYQYEPAESLRDCVFRGNHAHQIGGGVELTRSVCVLERCQILENSLDWGYGAGLSSFMDTTCELRECTIAGNETSESGGGVAIQWDSLADLWRCTIVDNTSDSGSGLYADGSAIEARESIVAFGNGPAVSGVAGGTITLECSDVFGNDGGDWVGPIADQANQHFNISADPLFCREQNPEAPYSVAADSPCAPGYPCPQMGAWQVGCGATGIDPALPADGGLVLRGPAPNPFNPRTAIAFALAREQRVKVSILDARGREIRILADRVFAAGPTSLSWDGRDRAGRDLPSGVFLMRAQTATRTQTVRAVLLR